MVCVCSCDSVFLAQDPAFVTRGGRDSKLVGLVDWKVGLVWVLMQHDQASNISELDRVAFHNNRYQIISPKELKVNAIHPLYNP